MEKFKPFNDGVLVKQYPKKDRTDSGNIIIPDTAGQQVMKGKVVDIGEGKYCEATGKFMPTRVKVGTDVFYFDGQAMPMTIEGQELFYMTEKQIIGLG